MHDIMTGGMGCGKNPIPRVKKYLEGLPNGNLRTFSPHSSCTFASDIRWDELGTIRGLIGANNSGRYVFQEPYLHRIRYHRQDYLTYSR